MLEVLIPLFDEKMAVKAYSVFIQKDNYLLNPFSVGTGRFDGASRIDALELLEKVGYETLAGDAMIFIPTNNVSIFADVDPQTSAPHEKICFLIDNSVPPLPSYIARLQELHDKGFKLGIRKLPITEFENYREVLKLMDFVFLNSKKVAIDKARIYFGKIFPNVSLCAGNIDTMEDFEKLRENGGYTYYEGDFYRVPITQGKHEEVAPLKMTYIELLNTVNNPNFELTEAADVISKDTALTIRLLEMVNRMTVNSGITTIRHAAAMLGQKELKKWINTAVANELYADKPGEMTRLSLLRAKFAENLATNFEMAIKKDELFLMGLFSILDSILNKPMTEALDLMKVSDDIRKALVDNSGALAPVYEFIKNYECANWLEVSRTMLIGNIKLEDVQAAYDNALIWYKDLTTTK